MRNAIILLIAVFALAASAREVAYLGVATEPVSPAIGRHLGFGEGVGVEVVHVDREGAVRGILEEGDILVQFNDQILVNHEQLAVLVRRQKPGDTVKLTYWREGQRRTAEVKLGKVDEERLAPVPRGGWGAAPDRPFGWTPEAFQRWMEELQARAWRPFGRRWMAPEEDEESTEPRTSPRADVRIQTHSSAVISESRDGVTVTVTMQDGRRSAKIVKDGQVVFDGPVNDDAEIGKVPEEYRERVADMLKRVRVEVRSSGDAPAPEKKSRGGTGLRRGNVL
ncbi:MAG: PDZ domain-containing protein [Kiritimatiellae bacterium]|nr:PDZ domain-containing protein [Kiritimatiellia bacterium]